MKESEMESSVLAKHNLVEINTLDYGSGDKANDKQMWVLFGY